MMRNFKINSSFICVLFLILIFGNKNLDAQNRWIEDRAMNFKINVPTNYQTNQLVDGTDKVHAFVSPDQNLVIRVRAFKLNQVITDVQLQSIFEGNIIKGAVKLIDESSDLNGLPARWCGYSWLYNNVSTVLTNYYIVRPDYAYVVWSICAENMVDQKTLEMSNIMGSFTLINGHPQNNSMLQSTNHSQSNNSTTYTPPVVNNQPTNQSSWNNNNSVPPQNSSGNQSQSSQTGTNSAAQTISNSYGGIQIASVEIGSEISPNLKITNSKSIISASAPKIQMVCEYSGNTNGRNFQVKWFSKTHNCLVVEASYLPTMNGQNRVHSFIENAGKSWPLGDYLAEVWFDNHKLSETAFSIGNEPKVTPPASAPTASCYADGKGNNQTKSLGGKYYALDLNKVNDNDIFEVRVTSGTLQFVTIHYRNSSGVWYTAYKGPNTKFRVGDVLNGKRNLYTHLIINVNAEHEKYLPVACYADIIINPSGQVPSVKQQEQTTNTPNQSTGTSSGKVKQIVLDNTNNTYDFDSGRVCSIKQNPEPDVINEPWCTALPALCGNWAKTGKSRMEDVTSAPASGFISDGKTFVDCQECPVNEVLVFKNKEGRMGKLMIIKDENSKVNGNCQHRITCLVEYPAFQ